MPKSKESFLKRWMGKIVIKEDLFKQIVKVREGVNNPVKSWSALKLIFLNYVADFYTSIIPSRYPDRYFFIDLFSGSGIGKVVDSKNDLILGSPLLIANGKVKFSKMFFCDYDEDYCDALRERLKVIGIPEDKFLVYRDDCNFVIDHIIPQVSHGHSLIFIDQYGMNITWENMEKILKLDADIIINFQTADIARARQKGRLGGVMEKFFKNKDEVKKIYRMGSGFIPPLLLQLYKRDIRNFRSENDTSGKKTITESIRIKKDATFYYDLILVTRETRGGSPWLQGILEAGKELENLDAKQVQIVLDVLQGRQKTLGDLKKFMIKSS